MPEEVLDAIAYDLDVTWYDVTSEIAQKRNVLKDVFTVYKTMGTAGAAKRAAKEIYEEAELQEWFQYGGKPGYFRIHTKEVMPSEQELNGIIQAVERVKKLSAHLEKTVTTLHSQERVGAGVGVALFIHSRIDMETPEREEKT